MNSRSARSAGRKGKDVAARPAFTLGDLLSSVTVIDVVCAPKGLDVAVGGTVMLDLRVSEPS